MSYDYNRLRNVIKSGNVKDIDNIINNEIHVNSTRNRITALELALEYDKFQVAKFLIDKGANPNIWVSNNPLTVAIAKNQLEMAKHLIQIGANTCGTVDFYYGMTPLAQAVKNGNIEIIQLLLDNGAEFTLLSGLMTAIQDGKLELLRLLLKRGASSFINDQDQNGYTPLIKSLKSNHVDFEIVNELVKSGADVNLVTSYGLPLTISIDRNVLKVFEMLIQNGADINKSEKEGEYPIMRVLTLGTREMVKLLIENGVKLDVKDSGGDTPFLKSVRMADYLMTKCFLGQNIDLNQKDEQNETALEIALEKFDFHTFKLLIEAGADPDLATESIQRMAKANSIFALYIETVQNKKSKDNTKGLNGQENASLN